MKEYQRMSEYPKIQKQADKFFNELTAFRKNYKGDIEQKNSFYSKWHKTKLYNNFGIIYCQILADTQ